MANTTADTVRVSQVRSMTFASGELQHYGGNQRIEAATTPPVMGGLSDGDGLHPSNNGGSRPVSQSSTLSDGPSPLSGGAGMRGDVDLHNSRNNASELGHHQPQSTCAFSPLSGSERLDAFKSAAAVEDASASAYASLSQPHASSSYRPPMRIVEPDPGGAMDSLSRALPTLLPTQGAPHDATPSSTLDTSLGPSTHPALAFTSEELVVTKYAALLSCLLHASQYTIDPASPPTAASLHQDLSRMGLLTCLTSCSGFREWLDMEEKAPPTALASDQTQEASTIVVFVTPRTRLQQQLRPPHDRSTLESEEASSIASSSPAPEHQLPNTPAVRPRPSVAQHLATFLSCNSLNEVIGVLVRDCIADFPKLVHVIVEASPLRQVQDAATNNVLGRRKSLAGGSTSTQPNSVSNSKPLVPPLSTWQTANAGGVVRGDSSHTPPHACHPRFLLARELAEAFVSLITNQVFTLSCDSPEHHARLHIAMSHLCERWPSAMEYLSSRPKQQAHHSGEIDDRSGVGGALKARASRTVSSATRPTSIAPPVMTPSDELVQLVVEWSRIATASEAAPHSEAPICRQRSADASGVEAPGYLFRIVFQDDLRLDPCAGKPAFHYNASELHKHALLPMTKSDHEASSSLRYNTTIKDQGREGGSGHTLADQRMRNNEPRDPFHSQAEHRAGCACATAVARRATWCMSSMGLALVVAVLSVVVLGVGGESVSSSAGVPLIVVCALLAAAAVLCAVLHVLELRRVARLQRFERQVFAVLTSSMSHLLAQSQRTGEASGSASRPTQPHNGGAGGSPPPPQPSSGLQGSTTVGSALGSMYAVSTPSPFPSNNASTAMDQQFFVGSGNQTPLGFTAPAGKTTTTTTINVNGNANASSMSAKKPNPLTAESLAASAFGADDDDDGVIRVRMDPTGTFLIPFMENEPILLDGVHVHKHMAVIGVEFAHGRGDEWQANKSTTIAGRSCDSTMLGDDVQDEDRYSICMWNLAMSEASGYVANQVVDQTLSQVVADAEGYNNLVERIYACEVNFETNDDGGGDSMEPILLNIVHKELGFRTMKMTLSPVVRWEAGDADMMGLGKAVCIGVLIVGVPTDAQGQVRAFNFRNLFLSEVLEEGIVATLASHALLARSNAGRGPQRSPLATPRHTKTPTGLGQPKWSPSALPVPPAPPAAVAASGGLTVSLAAHVSPNTTSILPSPHNGSNVARLMDHRRVNEYFMLKSVQELSTVASLSDQPWKAVYTNFIPGMLSKSFPKFALRVKVEPSVPSIVEANISGVTAIIDQILNTIPQGGFGVAMPPLAPGHHHQGNTPLAANPTLQLPPTIGLGGQELTTANIRVTFGVLQEGGVSMYCRIENCSLERYVDLLCRDIEMEELTGAFGAAGSAVSLIRSIEGKLVISAGSDDAPGTQGRSGSVTGGGGMAASSDPPSPSFAQRAESSLLSADAQASAQRQLPTQTQGPNPSLTACRDAVVIYFPFRMHNGANSAVSVWETRDRLKGASGTSLPSSVENSQRDTNLVSPSITVTGQQRSALLLAEGSGATSMLVGDRGAVGDAVVLSIMIDVQNELDRQKYIRRFWQDHHSVFPVDANKFLTRGLKLLRSQCRTFDVVLLDFSPLMSEEDFEKKMEDVAREFQDTTFVLLRPKRKRRRQLAQQVPPLHPKQAPKQATPLLEKQSSGLLSFMPPPLNDAPRPPNLHTITKAHTQQGVNELLAYVVARVMTVRQGVQRKLHIAQLFREHRASPWTKGKKLGRGTFGDVYEACLSLTGGKMAVKVIRLPTSDPNRLEQLINEVEILVKVQHPNIVQYFYCEAGTNAGEVNVFMELCTGGSLQAKCQSLQPTDIGLVSTWTQQLCSALAYLHRNHLAHRDIKPANILLTESGVVKVADFGTATAASMPLKEVAGTFAYMAPEVYEGADYGTPCDLWSVGCVLLDLLGKEALTKIVGTNSGGLGGGYFNECTSDDAIWQRLETHISEPLLVDFLRGCFRLDPMQRCTAEQLLLHPFLTMRRERLGSPPQLGGGPLGSGSLSVKRSTPNLTRKSQEMSVGALSVDSGEFGRRSSQSAFDAAGNDGNEDGSDESSDDGWGDIVCGAGGSDTEDAAAAKRPHPVVTISRPSMAAMSPGALHTMAGCNGFTPKIHNMPSPNNRTKGFVAESPAAAQRRRRHPQGASGDAAPGSEASPIFTTSSAALARRQSNNALKSQHSTSGSDSVELQPTASTSRN